MEIANLESLINKLDAKARQASREKAPSVIVGYTASYALHVHEDLEAYHRNGKAKFLEEPARILGPEMGDMVSKAYARGASFTQAIYIAALRLQRASQLEVPVDKGFLKNSAFTQVE